ncbi:MAG: hypothetical protein R2784_02170 [Saprospiraceae bacterium]
MVGDEWQICLSDLNVFDENYIASIMNNCPASANASFDLDMVNNCVTVFGIMQGAAAEACYQICLQNGDCFT